MPEQSTDPRLVRRRAHRAKHAAHFRQQARTLYAKHHPPEPLRADEIWLPVVGYEGLYEVSCCGRVRSRWNRGNHTIQERFSPLRPTVAPTGYAVVNLFASGRRQFGVHVLVATAFIGPAPSREHEVNHQDGCKTNNARGNLEWMTPSGNIRHALRTGLAKVGAQHPNAKLTPANVREIRSLAGVVSQAVMAERFGVSQSMISGIVNRKRWGHVV